MSDLDFGGLDISGCLEFERYESDGLTFEADLDFSGRIPEIYRGVTTVIPGLVAQELETANKFLKTNIIVEEIPYAQTGNLAGGYTVTIA